ncbi:MAG TPA: hypothetical protein VF228_23650, partial [Iamia sp.]
CTAEPTGAQILNLIKGKPGVPDATLRVFQGPFCSGTWSFATVEVDGHAVRIKVSPVRAKAEHDDVAAVADATGRSIPEIAARAEAAWWGSQP